MRAYNLTHPEMADAVKLAFGPSAQWKYSDNGLCPGYANKLDGWVYLPLSSPYRVAKSGSLTRYPCLHGYQALTVAVAQVKGTLAGWYLQPYMAQKVKQPTGTGWYAIKQALTAKGYACGPSCPSALDAPAPTSSAAHPVPPPVPPPLPGESRLFEPDPTLPALTDGTVDTPAGLQAFRQCRSLQAACTTTYVLVELHAAAAQIEVPSTAAEVPEGAKGRLHRDRIEWAGRMMRYRKSFAMAFGRNLFDFMVIASYSEARHSAAGYGHTYTFKSQDGASGGGINSDPLRYDPRSLAAGVARAHDCKLGYRGHSYGGFLWARIARYSLKFLSMAVRDRMPVLFADHVVDLAHNGGLMTNKGWMFDLPGNDFKAMLAEKHDGSLLAGTRKLKITEECETLVLQAVQLGIIPKPACAFDVKADHALPHVRWGTEKFTLKLLPGAPSDAQVAARYAQDDAAEKAAMAAHKAAASALAAGTPPPNMLTATLSAMATATPTADMVLAPDR